MVVVVLLRKGDERRVTAAIPRLRQRYGLTPAEVAAFSDWSTTIATRQASQLTIDAIQKRVADYYQLRHSDMLSKRRPNNIAIPRQIAMYLVRNLIPKHSLQEIGDAFGGRDHGTVIHACKAVDNMLAQDAHMKGQIEFLRSALSR